MGAVDHLGLAVTDVKHRAVSHRDEVQIAGMQHRGHQSGADAFLQAQTQRRFDHLVIGLAGAALDLEAEQVRVRFKKRPRQRDLAQEVLDDLKSRPEFDKRAKQWEQVLTQGTPQEKLQLIIRQTGMQWSWQLPGVVSRSLWLSGLHF